MKKLSVCISTYNRKDILLKSLIAICDQSIDKSEYQVVIVDDGSTDLTGEAVLEFIKNNNFPANFIKYIRQDNLGLSVGRNKAVKNADGKYILFIDDDVIASKDLVRQHLLTHQRFDKVVVNGWVNHVTELKRQELPKFTWKDFSTSFFWTSNVSVKREYLLQVGLFDEDFKEYGWEDLELGIRLKKLGLKKIVNKKAVVFHYKKEITKKDLQRMIKQAESQARSAIVFLKKQPGLITELAVGSFPLKLYFNRFINFKNIWYNFCLSIVNKEEKVLKGFPLFCFFQIIKYHYYKTLYQNLKS